MMSSFYDPFYDPENPHVGLKVKEVLGLLIESREPLTAEQINEHVDVEGDKAAFFEFLATNRRVHFDGHRFSYKPKPCARDKRQLRLLTHAFADADLKDKTVMEEESPIMADEDRQETSSRRALAPISKTHKMKKTLIRPNFTNAGLSYILQNVPEARGGDR